MSSCCLYTRSPPRTPNLCSRVSLRESQGDQDFIIHLLRDQQPSQEAFSEGQTSGGDGWCAYVCVFVCVERGGVLPNNGDILVLDLLEGKRSNVT